MPPTPEEQFSAPRSGAAGPGGQGLPPPARFNFADHLLETNAARAAKVAYIDDAGQLTYGALADRVRQFAAALRGLGLRRDERVLLLMLDSSAWPVVFLGSLYAGVVPVAVNTLLNAADLAYMLEHSRAQAAFVSAPLLPTLRSAMEQSGHELRSIVVSRGEPTAGTVDLEQLLARAEPLPAVAPTGADEPAFADAPFCQRGAHVGTDVGGDPQPTGGAP